MIEKVLSFTVESGDIFEHIIKEEDFEFNHVVIKPEFSFPPHPTDADVIITVVKGELTVVLEDQEAHVYESGQVIRVDQGVMSTLSNQSELPCEVFVIKRR